MTGATTLVDGWTYAKDGDDVGFDPVPSDAPAMWKATTQDFVAVVTMFGKYKNGTGISNKPDAGFTKLSCVRPEPHSKEKEKGDAKGKSDDKGSGAVGTISLASMLLVGAMFMLML